MSEKCNDCENWKQRGDELFDELDRTNNEYNGLADRLRTRDDEIARLQGLLTANGIDFQEEEDE